VTRRSPNAERPRVKVPGDLAEARDAAWDALVAWMSLSDERRFVARFGNVLVWLERSDGGTLGTVPLDQRRMIRLLSLAVEFGRFKKEKEDWIWTAAPPPRVVADDLVVDPRPPVPLLERVVEVPVLAPDGTLHASPGYDERSRCFYAPYPGLLVPSVPDKPLAGEIASARSLIVDELLSDFPFAGPQDGACERAHAVALLLLPFVRGLIGGPTPLHLIDAPTPGTGKTLLADVVAVPVLGGRPLLKMPESRDADEWRKRLTAKLRGAPAFVVIDNLRQPLDSSALALALTAGVFEDRILGESQMVELPVRCVWIATGNNPVLSDELTRRAIRIRLDAGVEFPEGRTGFRHPDLLGWAREHRGELVWAALVLARGWVGAGRPVPDGAPVLGGLEDWSRVLGGILGHAGIEGFLGNIAESRTAVRDDAAAGFLAAAHAARAGLTGEAEFATREVIGLAREHFALEGDDGHVLQRAGVRLREIVDRPMDGLVLRRAGTSRGTRRWRVEKVTR
jgi:putative DNA primase/helicase